MPHRYPENDNPQLAQAIQRGLTSSMTLLELETWRVAQDTWQSPGGVYGPPTVAEAQALFDQLVAEEARKARWDMLQARDGS